MDSRSGFIIFGACYGRREPICGPELGQVAEIQAGGFESNVAEGVSFGQVVCEAAYSLGVTDLGIVETVPYYLSARALLSAFGCSVERRTGVGEHGRFSFRIWLGLTS